MSWSFSRIISSACAVKELGSLLRMRFSDVVSGGSWLLSTPQAPSKPCSSSEEPWAPPPASTFSIPLLSEPTFQSLSLCLSPNSRSFQHPCGQPGPASDCTFLDLSDSMTFTSMPATHSWDKGLGSALPWAYLRCCFLPTASAVLKPPTPPSLAGAREHFSFLFMVWQSQSQGRPLGLWILGAGSSWSQTPS